MKKIAKKVLKHILNDYNAFICLLEDPSDSIAAEMVRKRIVAKLELAMVIIEKDIPRVTQDMSLYELFVRIMESVPDPSFRNLVFITGRKLLIESAIENLK